MNIIKYALFIAALSLPSRILMPLSGLITTVLYPTTQSALTKVQKTDLSVVEMPELD